MKIGILTQPLHNNYGGLLQNYALQTVLKRMGHEVWTIDREHNHLNYRKYGSLVKRLLIRSITGNKTLKLRVWPNKKETTIISQYTQLFIKENIQTTFKIKSRKQLSSLQEAYNFDTYIVGSDQVWRPKYSPFLPNYFLDFVQNNNSVKKIAYAASFGTDKWEFSLQETKIAKQLIKQFEAISVREDSALDLCKKYLEKDAVHLLDPTMLLSKEDYIELVNKANTHANKGNMSTYILDKNNEKSKIIHEISRRKNLIPFEVMPEKIFHEAKKSEIEKCVFPPVKQWIRSFIDTEFVVTDSFHGCVFSVIFNKTFLVIVNETRGASRFNSFLRKLKLEDRMIYSKNDLSGKLINKKIDWDFVNELLFKEREHSMMFLKQNL